jgi:hypothetical protein
VTQALAPPNLKKMNFENFPKLDGFLPKQPRKLYPSPGMCIYCGVKDNLSDEHIIPFALGGNLIMQKSSCPACAKITSAFELTCLRTMYGPLRLLYDLPTRRPPKRPKKLLLKVKYSADETEWQTILVDQKKYPFLVTFPYFETPGIVSRNQIHQSKGPVTKRLWIRGASPYYSFHELLEKLLVELKAYSIFPESKAEVPAFCKLLAKIAHAFAVAKLGLSGFTPVLKPIIIQNNLSNCMHYIGSANKEEAPENILHKLNILEFNSINAIFVIVRLLCKLGTPTYIVAVGTRK